MLNCLIRSLTHTYREHLLEEKWLIAPSRRTGHQWLESVARGGQPVLNTHVKTLNSMALDLAASEMAARGVTFLPGLAQRLLIDRILQGPLRGRLGYLNQVEPAAGFLDVILASINAIRLAGLSSTDFSKESFEVSAKGADLAMILDEYQKLLAGEKKIDYADVLIFAADRLLSDPGCLGPDTIVLLPEDMELTALERRLLTNLRGDRLQVLSVETVPGLPGSKRQSYTCMNTIPAPGIGGALDTSPSCEGTGTSLHLMRWVLDMEGAPAPFSDGTVAVTHAVGEVSEVRGVLRRCIARGIPWDEVEILHTDTDTYVPLIYETFMSIYRRGDESGENLPVMPDGKSSQTSTAVPHRTSNTTLPITFREGIPCRYSRPGQALAAWLAWVRDGFPQAILVKMVREGLLEPPGGEESFSSFTRCAALLRGVGISFGRDRYLPKLTEQIKILKNRLAYRNKARENDDGISSTRTEGITRDLRDLEVLKDLVTNLLDNAPDDHMEQKEIVTRAKGFLRTTSRSIDQLDRYALRMLVEKLEDMEYWLGCEDRETGIDIWEWLGSLTAGTSVLGSGPRPGCLHVDNIQSGGHSGRRHTFIVGLDDSRFPGRVLQDPLLLDSERQRISPEMPTAAKRLDRKMENFVRLLARLDGHVTLSFASKSLTEDRAMFPSPVILPVYRLLTGDIEGDQEKLMSWLPPPESIAPTGPEQCLNTAEWWLWRMTGPLSVENAVSLVHERFTHLARGDRAADIRAGTEYTGYDGLVPVAGRDLDPTSKNGPVMSSSRLQTMGRCPRAFFFEYGLEIEPPEDLEIDTRRWLDALNRGSLLHELFEEFMRQKIEEDRLPEFVVDHGELERLLEIKVAEYRELFPPPGESVFLGEVNGLKQTARTFLREEARYFVRKDRAPVFLEASIGMPSGSHPTALDTGEPVPVRLPGGRTIRVRGRVDRIDRVYGGEGGVYHIWDYKTGSTWGYSKAEPFREGRRVQPYLYMKIVSDCLRKTISPKADVSAFGFFFPGERAVGERLVWTPEELADGGQVIEQLVQMIANGAFTATNNHTDDCRFCDYRPICGDLPALESSTMLKLKNRENSVLAPFRELRNIGVEGKAAPAREDTQQSRS